MQNLFDEVGSLDQRCYREFGLNEDLLMEHAADGMADFVKNNFPEEQSVLILCGSGNNGADGLALSRILHKDYDVKVVVVKEPKSEMAQLQYLRCQKIGVKFTDIIEPADIVIDAILGTGFSGELPEELSTTIHIINQFKSIKIACDIPSAYQFQADYTLTMGALKTAMFEDKHKDYLGEITVLDLGVSRTIYEVDSNVKLLDENDLQLPHRDKQNTHKGSYGHLAVVSGEKTGASIMSAKAAFRFGTALVTLLSNENINVPFEIMQSHQLPETTSALALGMGLGMEFSQSELERFVNNDLPLLLDADIFYHPLLKTLLERKNVVITPHPKEFCRILECCNIAEIKVQELQENRFKYVKLFSEKHPDVILVLKGANVIISRGEELFVNPHGTNVLAKGGSGDVLAGLISGLLAQGDEPLQAAINGSLAHTALAKSYKGADFSLTPIDLIDGIGKL
ncbi:NAD(P)H-hydrate dehydratase [Sulfurimonas sp. C5]|uniref:NAD(P)H-hydrate dehydratase n=1 Tax=Sulfurimonas sp. C5 TaxID=3036947 RepID=UPI0024565232|nr:NAD(P)H-hydrate dehydratase [Sulfurimonas sp. C5]MDH4944360.1 NAD(P)H-hydrate dehydratase [Sulfurimonas sp. C5]